MDQASFCGKSRSIRAKSPVQTETGAADEKALHGKRGFLHKPLTGLGERAMELLGS